MENSSRLAFAAFLARDVVQLKLTKLEWPTRLGFSLFDYEASIVLGSKSFIGRGVHESETQSIDIAIAEAFERSLLDSSPDVAAVAVHLDLDRAAEAARLELIERDAFFCHFLTSTPMRPLLEISRLDIWNQIENVCREFNIRASAFSMVVPAGSFATLIALVGTGAKKNPFGVRLGMGCSAVSLQAAFDKSVREVLPMLAHAVFSERLESIQAVDLFSNPKPHQMHHRKWAFNRDSLKSMSACLTGEIGDRLPVPLDSRKISTREISRPESWPQLLPLVGASAFHPSAIRTFFGSNLKAAEFSQRLEEFSGRPFKEILLPSLPHPIG